MTQHTQLGSGHLKKLLEQIKNNGAVIGIIGLNEIGLPLAPKFISCGYRVIGYETDLLKIDKLMQGHSTVAQISNHIMSAIVEHGRFEATDEFHRINEADIVFICVPTILDRLCQPDMTALLKICQRITPHLRPGQLIILEGTCYPGAMSEEIVPILEQSRLSIGEELFVGCSISWEFSPDADVHTGRVPVIIGTNNKQSRIAMENFFSNVFKRVHALSSTEAVELCNLFEPTYHYVNSALICELKAFCSRIGIDIWEILEALPNKMPRANRLHPFPDMGGRLVPSAPFLLSWKARQYDSAMRFIDLAGEIHSRMPYELVDQIVQALNHRGIASRNGRLLVLGISIPKNSNINFETPTFKIIYLLIARGITITYYDPEASIEQFQRNGLLATESISELTHEALEQHDAVLILSENFGIDYEWVVRHARLVIDTRSATANTRGGHRKVHAA